jgi:hypothetical protein
MYANSFQTTFSLEYAQRKILYARLIFWQRNKSESVGVHVSARNFNVSLTSCCIHLQKLSHALMNYLSNVMIHYIPMDLLYSECNKSLMSLQP